jgi:hypothetical protein
MTCMILLMATGLVINNTGLPAAVLLSLCWVVGGMVAGWFAIVVYQMNMWNEGIASAQEQVHNNPRLDEQWLFKLIESCKREIVQGRTWIQECCTFKFLHSLCMIWSLCNIAGRLQFSPPYEEYKCHTYPMLKKVVDGKQCVQIHDPNSSDYPWVQYGMLGWLCFTVAAPLALAGVLFLTAWACNRPHLHHA